MRKNLVKSGLAVLLTGAMCMSLITGAPYSAKAADGSVEVVASAQSQDPYYREDPGLGQVPIELASIANNWNPASTIDYRVPRDYDGSTCTSIAYPFGDGKETNDVLLIDYKFAGRSTFGGVTTKSAWNLDTVNIPNNSTIEFDLYYPKSAQGKYMRFRMVATNGNMDTYIRDLDYTNLNPDWIGSYDGETWLKKHFSITVAAGTSTGLTIELHGENGRSAEEGKLMLGGIKVLMPDENGTPLPMAENTEHYSAVAPLKSKYNTENGLFMVGAIGTGNVNGARAYHYEIFVDGNNLKADGTHPTGPKWLVGVDGTSIGTADGGFSSEYRIPTWAYQQIRDSGSKGEYKSHGHVMAWYNQAPSWMTRIIPEHLTLGYEGTPEYYGYGNNVNSSNTVKVDKDVAKRVQYNHIVNIMRHFYTTEEKYGSSEERGVIEFNSWDILNEEVHESRHSQTIAEDPNCWKNSLKNTNWLAAMSDDDINSEDVTNHYIYLLFKYAHIAVPNQAMADAYKANYDSLPEYMKLDGHDTDGSIDAYVVEDTPKLTYNDYGTSSHSKSRVIYNMVRELNTAWQSDPLYDGRPLIEDVGFQGHDTINTTLATDNQYAMGLCAKLIDEGLLSGISFSELDLKFSTDTPGGAATAPAALNVRQSDALGYEYALFYKLFDKFALYIDHIMSWGVQGSGWQGSYVLFDGQGNANAGYYGAMDPDRFILGHSYLDEYFNGEFASIQDGVAIDLGDLGMYTPKTRSKGEPVEPDPEPTPVPTIIPQQVPVLPAPVVTPAPTPVVEEKAEEVVEVPENETPQAAETEEEIPSTDAKAAEEASYKIKPEQLAKAGTDFKATCKVETAEDKITLSVESTTEESVKLTVTLNASAIADENAKVYIYKLDKETGKLVEIPNNAKKLNAKGEIKFVADTNAEYVVLAEKQEENVDKLIDKVTVTAAKSVKVGKKLQVNVDVTESLSLVSKFDKTGDPYGTEEVKVKYSVDDKSIATISSTGELTAKKAGTVKVSVKITLENGDTKTITKKITVK